MAFVKDKIVYGRKIGHRPAYLEKISLGAYICDLLKTHGKNVVHIDAISGKSHTYEDVLIKSLQLADALTKRGYRRGDIISISSENRLEYPILLVASSLIGITLSTVNPAYTEGELEHLFNLTHPIAVFCSPLTFQKILKMSSKFPQIRELIVYDYEEPFNEPKRVFSYKSIIEIGNPDEFEIPAGDFKNDVAVILTSSGTTGLPKGVMLSHNNFLTLFEILRQRILTAVIPDNFEIVFMALVPFFHGYGFLLALHSLCLRIKLVILPNFNEKTFLSSIEKYKINQLALVPPLMIFLAKSPLVEQYNLSSVMQVFCGAAPVGKSTLEQVSKRLNIPIEMMKQGYGMTELTIIATMSDPDSPAHAVGTVVPLMKMKVLDVETGELLGPNQTGELCFQGPMVMKGYINNTKETENTIDKEGWLHTGDVGYYDEALYVYIVDRIKELIKVKGFQVAPAELEALLTNHPEVQDAAVIGIADELSGEVPLAFVVKKQNSNVTEKELESYVSDLVSSPKRLRGGVIFIDAIPKNPSGKILRRVLRERIKNKSKL